MLYYIGNTDAWARIGEATVVPEKKKGKRLYDPRYDRRLKASPAAERLRAVWERMRKKRG